MVTNPLINKYTEANNPALKYKIDPILLGCLKHCYSIFEQGLVFIQDVREH